MRNAKQAIAHATQACELGDWKDPYSIGTLSVALAEDGQFDKAIELLNKRRQGADEIAQWLFDQHLMRFRAKKTYRQAEQERIARDAAVDPIRKEVLMGLCREAAALTQAHRTAEAIVVSEKAVARAKEVLGKDHVEVGKLLVHLGDLYLGAAKHERAVGCFTQALAIFQQHLPRGDDDVTYAVNNLALTFSRMKRYEEAIRLDAENLRVREATLGKDHPHTLLSLHNLGMSYAAGGHPREAIATLETWLKSDPRAKRPVAVAALRAGKRRRRLYGPSSTRQGGSASAPRPGGRGISLERRWLDDHGAFAAGASL